MHHWPGSCLCQRAEARQGLGKQFLHIPFGVSHSAVEVHAVRLDLDLGLCSRRGPDIPMALGDFPVKDSRPFTVFQFHTTTATDWQKWEATNGKKVPQHFATNPKMNANCTCFSNLPGIGICVNNQLEHLVCKVCQVALVTKSSSTPLTRTGSLLGLCSQLIHHNQSIHRSIC